MKRYKTTTKVISCVKKYCGGHVCMCVSIQVVCVGVCVYSRRQNKVLNSVL